MLGWLYGILIGNFCMHEWETIRQFEVRVFSDCPPDFKTLMRCKKCGNMKHYTIKNTPGFWD